jgi:branched-chain amino acid aminotransferase
MALASAKYAWLDGEFVPWEDAKIHIRCEAVMRGISVFEGLRGYWSAKKNQMYVFRVPEHFKRLEASMKILRLKLPYDMNVVENAMLELIRRCGHREDVHMRVNVYVGDGEEHTPDPSKTFIGAFITALARPAKKTIQTGTHATVSSWRRIDDQSMPPRVKVTGNYVNSRLAQVQAKVDGYETAILLDQFGKVAETAAACLMVIRDGVVHTPTITDSILEGVTRDTLIELFTQELGVKVTERAIDRTELYLADEIIECGSGHEVSPIVSVDRMTIGSGEPGPLTRAVQDKYLGVVRGDQDRYASWLTSVY